MTSGALARFLHLWRWFRESYPRGSDRTDPLTLAWKAFRERLSPVGKTLGAVWAVLLPLAALSHGWLGGSLFAVCSAMLLVSVLWTLLPPRLEATLELPATARVGAVFPATIRLRTTDGSPLGDRGAGVFRVSDGLAPLVDGRLAPDPSASEATLVVPLLARRRGIERVEGATVLGLDPLGFARSRRFLRRDRAVAVLPAIAPVRDCAFLRSGPSGREFSRLLLGLPDSDAEFAGIRPWREGDSVRDLHHRSWARRGEPVVRESAGGRGGGIAVLYESCSDGFWQQSLSEPAISLAAGVAAWLAERGRLGRFFVDSSELDLAGPDPLAAVLDGLARAPRGAGWIRLPPPGPWLPVHPVQDPVLAIGFSSGRAASPDARIRKRLRVGWDAQDQTESIHIVSPEALAAGRDLFL